VSDTAICETATETATETTRVHRGRQLHPNARKPTEGLTPRELAGLNWIAGFMLRHHGMSPTVRELCKGLGNRSSTSGQYLLNRLAEKGYIQRERGQTRSIVIVDPDNIEMAKIEQIKQVDRDKIERAAAVCEPRAEELQAKAMFARCNAMVVDLGALLDDLEQSSGLAARNKMALWVRNVLERKPRRPA